MTTIPSGGFPVLCSSEAKYLTASKQARRREEEEEEEENMTEWLQ